jgi:hypothetical protein
MALGFDGNDLGKGGLSTAGRAIKNQAPEIIGLDQPREETIRGKEVLLPKHLAKSAGSHANRKRSMGGYR